jgi:hypothetical protein
MNAWGLPDIADVEKPPKNFDIAEWAGVKMPDLKAMYKEELAVLMPKIEPAEKKKYLPGHNPGSKKGQGMKAKGRKSLPTAEEIKEKSKADKLAKPVSKKELKKTGSGKRGMIKT